MKIVAAYLLAAAVGVTPPSSLPQPQDGAVTITVPASEVAKCAPEGGCAIVTRAYLEQLVSTAKQQAEKACYRSRSEV